MIMMQTFDVLKITLKLS